MIEQLKKTPARISLLSLILSSEPHRRAIQNVLNEAYVKPDVTPEGVVNMVDPIRRVNAISFSEEEILPCTRKGPKALYITLKCRGYVVAGVLIDGGSTLNVVPFALLEEMEMSLDDLQSREITVRAFDGTRRGILGEVTLPVEIGPSCFQVLFQVMDIKPIYSMLLGRPWIHKAGAVPSTVHQCLKYIEEGSVITIRGEEEVILSKPVFVPYVENVDEDKDTSLHNFELVEPEQGQAESSIQTIDRIGARIMFKSGYQEGKGLGVHLQGIPSPVSLPEKQDQFGLGYEATVEERMESLILSKKKGKKDKKIFIPHLRETFPAPSEILIPGETANPQYHLVINALEEGPKKSGVVRLVREDEHLNNWKSELVMDVVATK